MKKNKLLLLILLCLPIWLIAVQKEHIDSLVGIIERNPKASLQQIEDNYKRAEYLGTPHYDYTAAYLLGTNHFLLQHYRAAVNYLQEAVGYSNIPLLLKGQLYTKIGICYDYLGEYDKSFQAHMNAMRISESLKNKVELTRNYINIGLIYAKQKNFPLSKKNLDLGLSFAIDLKDTIKIGLCYQNLGFLYYEESKFDSVMMFNDLAIELYHKSNHIKGVLQCLYNKGIVNEDLSNHAQAQAIYSKILNHPAITNHPYVRASTLLMMGRSLSQTNQSKLARMYTDSARGIVEKMELNVLDEQLIINELFLSKPSNLDSFKHYLSKFISIKDEQQKVQVHEALAEIQTIYDMESTQNELKTKALTLDTEKKINIMLIIAILVMGVLVVILYTINKKLEESYKLLFVRNNEISKLIPSTDSVIKSVQTILYKPDIHAKLYVEILELLDRKLHVENPDLTLKELAKLLGSNEMYVSQAINQVSGKNFNKFINGYRIEEAKKILLDPNQTKLSMEEVAAMSGFTSVNTFYRQFKDQTGLTPSQYKRLN